MRVRSSLTAAAAMLVVFAGYAASRTPTRTWSGPLRVEGRNLVDPHGNPVLLRGTQVLGLSRGSDDLGMGPGHHFGALSATALNAIHNRWNMNVIHLPVDVERYMDEPGYPTRLQSAVENAHRQELMVVLAAVDPGSGLPSARTVAFWSKCALQFKEDRRVFFDAFSAPRASAIPGHLMGTHSKADWAFWLKGGVATDGTRASGMQDLIDTIRETGASQPILVASFEDLPLFEGLTPDLFPAGAGIAYEVNLRFREVQTDEQRERYFGFLADQVPVVVNDWDLNLDHAEDCAALPKEPNVVERIERSGLDYFARRHISWTLSTFAPGKLITDSAHFFATTLDNGLACGSSAGMGIPLQYHLLEVPTRGLVTTCLNATFVLPRGGVAQTYGPTLGDEDADGHNALPTKLSNLSVEIKDSAGSIRLAPLLHVGAGWAFINFVVPMEAATGPATVSVVRSDGSRVASSVVIDDISPAWLNGNGIGWGPVVGFATQNLVGGASRSLPTYQCGKESCKTLPIPVSRDVATTVRLIGTGFRNLPASQKPHVEIAGMPVPVLSFGPAAEPGSDQVIVRIPSALRGFGEADLTLKAGGRIANVARIRLGTD